MRNEFYALRRESYALNSIYIEHLQKLQKATKNLQLTKGKRQRDWLRLKMPMLQISLISLLRKAMVSWRPERPKGGEKTKGEAGTTSL